MAWQLLVLKKKLQGVGGPLAHHLMRDPSTRGAGPDEAAPVGLLSLRLAQAGCAGGGHDEIIITNGEQQTTLRRRVDQDSWTGRPRWNGYDQHMHPDQIVDVDEKHWQ